MNRAFRTEPEFFEEIRILRKGPSSSKGFEFLVRARGLEKILNSSKGSEFFEGARALLNESNF